MWLAFDAWMLFQISKRTYSFCIVFYSIFELWGLLEKVTFLDVSQIFFITPHENIVSAFWFYSTSAPWAFFENVFFFCCFCKLLIAISTSCVGELAVCRKPFFLTSLWWLAFGAPGPLASFFYVFFNELMGIRIWRMSAFSDHSTRKCWFYFVFYSTFALWAIFENVLFFDIFWVFCKPLILISILRVGVIFGHVLVMQQENIDFLWFFIVFLSCGHLFLWVIFG